LDNDAVMPEADVTPDVDSYNKYLAARVILPRGDVLERETITPGRGTMREPWSVKHTFLDGHVGEYSTNIIAENMYATVIMMAMKRKFLRILSITDLIPVLLPMMSNHGS